MSFLSKCCCACSSKRTCCESANLNERNGVVQEHSFTALQHESQTVERSAQKLNSSFSAPNEIVVCSSTSFVRLTFWSYMSRKWLYSHQFVFFLHREGGLKEKVSKECIPSNLLCFISSVTGRKHESSIFCRQSLWLAQVFDGGHRTQLIWAFCIRDWSDLHISSYLKYRSDIQKPSVEQSKEAVRVG